MGARDQRSPAHRLERVGDARGEYGQFMAFSSDDRIKAIAGTARESSRRGSDIIDVRIYVRDEGHAMGGEIIALDTAGKPLRRKNGDEIALPLSKHEHVGPVLQEIADLMQEARRVRRASEQV